MVERDIHNLVRILLSSSPTTIKDFEICILPHASTKAEAQQWLDNILASAFENYKKSYEGDEKSLEETWKTAVAPKFVLVPDPDRSAAEAYGVGTTASGSDRWATHGACWVDAEGVVRRYEKAETAHFEFDWKAGLQALGINVA
ncbi:hypothetical protein D9758_000468 [Tetrapyrgos nigripes]|uniref:Uncharacterized protein n=1 Tax=Tetrapyrgos nigripes TaxID=182062 RepID=A0A8H5LZ37_9AGAR|nr:hypothetical protein D9758_000468 [Tetrapyrgos nigripes]